MNFKEWLITEDVYGKLATVFHRTPKLENVKNIAKNGFDLDLWGKSGGRTIDGSRTKGPRGEGIYATFTLPSQFKNRVRTNMSIYGNFIIKCLVNLDSFIVFDKEMAQKVHGTNWQIKDQLEHVLGSNWIKIPGLKEFTDGISSKVGLHPGRDTAVPHLTSEKDVKYKGEFPMWNFDKEIFRDIGWLDGKPYQGHNDSIDTVELGSYKFYHMFTPDKNPLFKKIGGLLYFSSADGEAIVSYNPDLLKPLAFAYNEWNNKKISPVEFHPIKNIFNIREKPLDPTLDPTLPWVQSLFGKEPDPDDLAKLTPTSSFSHEDLEKKHQRRFEKSSGDLYYIN